MDFKSSRKTATILLIIVLCISILTAIGWIWNVPLLTNNIIPETINMKFITSISFIFTTIALLKICIEGNKKAPSTPIFLFICGVIVLFLMATSLFSILGGVKTGIESLFVKDVVKDPYTPHPGAASVATAVNFILLVGAIFVFIIGHKTKEINSILGILVALIGLSAVIGYLAGIPPMYYYFSEGSWTNPIAFKTAFLFVLTGSALVLLSCKMNKR